MELNTISDVLDDGQKEAIQEAFHSAQKRQAIVAFCIDKAIAGSPSHHAMNIEMKIDDWGLDGSLEKAINAPEGTVFEIESDQSEQQVVRAEAISPTITIDGIKRWVAHNQLMDEVHILENDARIRVERSFA